jgi:hypothetical protein
MQSPSQDTHPMILPIIIPLRINAFKHKIAQQGVSVPIPDSGNPAVDCDA